MSITFSSLYEHYCHGKFGVSRRQVRQTIDHPDSIQIIKLDKLELGFYLKYIVQPNQEFYILACTRKELDAQEIDLAFRILPSFVDQIMLSEPLLMLQKLALQFGVTFKIGQQLNKFIMHAEIVSVAAQIEATKVIELIDPPTPSLIISTFLKVEGQIISCALAYTIDTAKYVAWLYGREPNTKVIIDISPAFRGQIAQRDVIGASGTLFFAIDTRELEIEETDTVSFFRVITYDYHLEVGFTDTNFYILRNRDKLETPFAEIALGKTKIYASWSADQLQLIIFDESYREIVKDTADELRYEEIEKRTKTLRTSATLPPNSLIDWARKQTVASTNTYRSTAIFHQTVTDAIQSIADKVSTLGAVNSYWDITYEGRKKIKRVPKKETDIHPTIHTLLFDIGIAKNFKIAPEHPIAGGRLDFLITGSPDTGKTVSVCVEFKHAHSDDLEHGLLEQLPTYMQAEASDYGIYCVMFFKGQYFNEPHDHDFNSLHFFLTKVALAAGQKNIRPIVLNFSHSIPPSKI